MIGNKILELRKKNSLTQEELAKKMDVARQTISKWELGETSPDLSEAKKLSEIFNVSLDELTGNFNKNERLFQQRIIIILFIFQKHSYKILIQ